MPVGKPFVVDSEKMENGSVQVVDGAPVFNSVVTEFICAAVAESAFYSRARHPHRKSIRMVVPAYWAIALLRCRRPTKFSSPEDQSVLE